MNKDLQKLRDKLESLLKDTPLVSEEVLSVSEEVDLLILEFYRKQNFSQEYSCSKTELLKSL
jgi:hypothetical protein